MLIFVLIILAIDLYAFQAIRYMLMDSDKLLKYSIFGLYWLVSLAFIVLALLEAREQIFVQLPKNLRTIILATFFILFLSKMLMSSMLIIDDLRRLYLWVAGLFSKTEHITNLGRSKFLSRAAAVMGALPIVILGYGIVVNAFRYRLFRRKVKIKGLAGDLQGLKIIQISDIHSGSFWRDKPIDKAIRMINEEKADLIFFTGDLVNEQSAEVQPYKDVFKQVKSKYGVFSILGNHDYGDYYEWKSQEEKAENMQEMYAAHSYMGWDLLRNENRQVQIKDSTVQIIGVENYSAKPHFPKYGDLDRAVEGVNRDDLCLLLSHDPTHWDSHVLTKPFEFINMTFSGHTHGMQFGIEIPGLFRWSPAKFMYPRWADLYQEGEQYLYVNRGFGFLGYPGRVGILPEITVIELESA